MPGKYALLLVVVVLVVFVIVFVVLENCHLRRRLEYKRVDQDLNGVFDVYFSIYKIGDFFRVWNEVSSALNVSSVKLDPEDRISDLLNLYHMSEVNEDAFYGLLVKYGVPPNNLSVDAHVYEVVEVLLRKNRDKNH